MKNRARKLVTKKDFNSIKKLIDAGLNNGEIQNLTGRGNATISRMRSAKDYKDYKYIVGTLHNKKPKVKNEENPTPKMPKTELEAAINLLNDNLVLLCEKLEGYNKSVEALTIATYSLRKTSMKDSAPNTKTMWFGKK